MECYVSQAYLWSIVQILTTYNSLSIKVLYYQIGVKL